MSPSSHHGSTADFGGIIAHHSKSFALARKLLPEPSASAAAVVYAWCRRCDDAIDHLAGDAQRTALTHLQDELSRVYAGEALTDPVLHGFQRVVFAFGIPQEYPRELLEGMRMDVEHTTYASLGELLLYCHRVAGVVGLMMCHVMGVGRPSALRHAAHLGIAMQLTNICRDVAEDWQMGRVYLPGNLLQAAGISLPTGTRADNLTRPWATRAALVVETLLTEAQRYYLSGDAGLLALPWRSAWAVRSARLIYAAIGERIAAQRFDVLAPRAVTSRFTKWRLVLYAGLLTLLEWPSRLRVPVRPVRPDEIVRFPRDVLPV